MFQVELPGVCPEVLLVLLKYIYFDSVSVSFPLTICDYIEALELANRCWLNFYSKKIKYLNSFCLILRMCLSRLTNLLENDVVSFLEEEEVIDESGLVEEILHIIEPAQVQYILHSFCFFTMFYSTAVLKNRFVTRGNWAIGVYIIFLAIINFCWKIITSFLKCYQLPIRNTLQHIGGHQFGLNIIILLEINTSIEIIVLHTYRFVKEMELYEKTLRDGQKSAEIVASKLLKRNQTSSSGCLCFSARKSKRYQHNSIWTTTAGLSWFVCDKIVLW